MFLFYFNGLIFQFSGPKETSNSRNSSQLFFPNTNSFDNASGAGKINKHNITPKLTNLNFSGSSRGTLTFEDYVIKSLERLHQKIDLQGELLVDLSDRLKRTGTGHEVQDKCDFEFPLDSMQKVDQLQEKLQDDSQFKSLVGFLSTKVNILFQFIYSHQMFI